MMAYYNYDCINQTNKIISYLNFNTLYVNFKEWKGGFNFSEKVTNIP